MNPIEFWKNFTLGTELQISGSFIYNSIYTFDRMKFFYFEEECFEFLYQASVGLERLLKIVVVLAEHGDYSDQEAFEKSLITHNHLELFKRLKNKLSIEMPDVQIHFLTMVSNFYKSSRYDHFGIRSVFNEDSSKTMLIEFFEKHLKIKINAKLSNSTEIDDRMKNFIGRTIGKISTKLYKQITVLAQNLNLYTYEITHDSKAYKIFMVQDFTFEKEKKVRRELLIAYFHKKFDQGYVGLIDEITPLNFESDSAKEYIKYLVDIHPKQDIIDEMESLYEDVPYNKKRLELVSVIGSDIDLEGEGVDDE